MLPEWIFCSCHCLKASEHNAHNACLPFRKGTLNILLCSCLPAVCLLLSSCVLSAGPRRTTLALLLPKRGDNQGPECGAAGAIWFSRPIAGSWMLVTSRQSHPIPSAVWGDALDIAVENCTKGDRPRSTAVPERDCQSHGSCSWATHPWWMGSGFVCIYPGHKALQKMFPNCSFCISWACSLVSAALLLCCCLNAAKPSPPEGSSPVKRMGL